MHAAQLIGLVAVMAASVQGNPVPQMDDEPNMAARDAYEAGCTLTVPIFPPFTAGPTYTVWTTTTTKTRHVDCGSCTAVTTSHLPFGPGPVVFFTTTVTATEPRKTTVLACGKPEPPTPLTDKPEYSLAPVSSDP